MHKLLAVIRREYVERVRSRAFVVGTVLGPLLMATLFLLPIMLERRETAPKRIVVLDAATGTFGAEVEAALRGSFRGGDSARPRYRPSRVLAGARAEATRDSLIGLTGLTGKRREGVDALDGVLVLTDSGLASGRLEYYGENVGSPSDMRILEGAMRPPVLRERLARAGVTAPQALDAVRPVDLDTRKVSQGKVTGESGESSFWLAYAMGFILYFSLVLYGVQVMSSVVEEKSNRIIEVLASSLTPFQLLLGKVLGVGLVGLTQLGIWAGTAMYLTTYGGTVLKLLGVKPSAAAAGEAAGAGVALPAVSPELFVVFLTFFLLGFFLYAAAYAAIGAMCNSTQDTQQANTPVTLCIVFGFFSTFALLNEPNGSLARLLSMIPLSAPFATPLRYSITPLPLGELLLSAGLTLLGVLGVTWVASRIYRVGILAYGKKPSLAELGRWVLSG